MRPLQFIFSIKQSIYYHLDMKTHSKDMNVLFLKKNDFVNTFQTWLSYIKAEL